MTSVFEFLVGICALGACWMLWFYFVKEERVDAFREELFTIRKDLFMLAATGQISFDEKAYSELRYLINGMLRFGHNISVRGSFIASQLQDKDPGARNAYNEWQNSLKVCPRKVQEELNAIHRRMFRCYMNHLVRGSVVLIILTAALVVKSAIEKSIAKIFSAKKSRFDVMDVAVNAIANSFGAKALEEQAYRDQADSRDLLHA